MGSPRSVRIVPLIPKTLGKVVEELLRTGEGRKGLFVEDN